MPNHVRNELRISGDNRIIKQLESFVQSATETPNAEQLAFDFNNIIPQPNCVIKGCISLEEQAAYPNRNWYDWNIAHWDTKWNAYDCVRGSHGNYSFTTAWSAPLKVIAALSWLYPELVFTLYCEEEAGSFHGEVQFKQGRQFGDLSSDDISDANPSPKFLQTTVVAS